MSSVFIYAHPQFVWQPKCVAFDLDDTLLSLNNIPMYDLQQMNKLIADGLCIVIISNQKNRKPDTIKKRLVHLDFPFIGYFALADDEFRKPNIGIPKLIRKDSIITSYIGDAKGRPEDHSDCDYQLYENCKNSFPDITYFTPEDYFSKDKIYSIPPTILDCIEVENINKYYHLNLVLLIGLPASGKSTLAKKFINYKVINNDTISGMKKCESLCRTNLQNKKSVVIDNLNCSVKSRSKFIQLANTYGAAVICIYVNTAFHICFDRNKKREHSVPDIVLYKFRKDFQYPTVDEGIDEIFTLVTKS